MRGTSANDYVVVDPRWRGEIEWADVLPNRPGMFAVRTRGNRVRAGEIEVRWYDRPVCWVDGRWRSVEDLLPAEALAMEEC